MRRTFQKQRDERWSREIFTITGRSIEIGIPQYTLQDYSGAHIKGTFYQKPLLKACPSETFLFERVLGRKRSGLEEVLVKWKGWDKRYNSWIKAAQF